MKDERLFFFVKRVKTVSASPYTRNKVLSHLKCFCVCGALPVLAGALVRLCSPIQVRRGDLRSPELNIYYYIEGGGFILRAEPGPKVLGF